MFEDRKGEGVMSAMKPIQATPELSGKDAEKLFNQVNVAPTKKALKKM